MKLANAKKVCEEINKNAAYAFLFHSDEEDTEHKVNTFIARFSDQNDLIPTPIAPDKWAFTHRNYGQLNDGVIQVQQDSVKPTFIFRDVSQSKITENSPDIGDDLVSVSNRFQEL